MTLSILAGTATVNGNNGADYWMKHKKTLPGNYIAKKAAENAGWLNYRGNLHEVLPGTAIGGDVYRNKKGQLPDAPGRIWYEADIDYTGGFRNTQRILFSNDGLLFVTYDHYNTFYEIV